MKIFREKIRTRLFQIKAILKDDSGLSVVEMILILVGNFTPYLGCVLCG